MHLQFSDLDILCADCILQNVQVRDNQGHRGLFVNRNIGKGCIVYTTLTVLVDADANITYKPAEIPEVKVDHVAHLTNVCQVNANGAELFEFTYFDIFLNNSCDPNVYYLDCNDNKQTVVALRDIVEGEELVVDYDGLDYISTDPFECTCDTARCTGQKRGFAFLTRSQQQDYLHRGIVTPYVIAHQAEDKGKS